MRQLQQIQQETSNRGTVQQREIRLTQISIAIVAGSRSEKQNLKLMNFKFCSNLSVILLCNFNSVQFDLGETLLAPFF